MPITPRNFHARAEHFRQLARLEQRLALPDTDANVHLALRARAGILAMSEALAEHGAYFDDRVLT